jgi:MFS family permease
VSSVAPPAAALAAPQAFASVLRERPYRRLWLSGLCVNGARWMDLILLGWLAFQLTDSPFMVGLAAFARSAPLMVLGPFTGLVADRMHRGRVLVVTQSLGLVTGFTLAAVFAAGRGGFWPLVGLEMLFGVVWALDFPARRTALYSLVGSRRVATAISLETVSMQVAKMVGPVLAGVGLAHLGPAPATRESPRSTRSGCSSSRACPDASAGRVSATSPRWWPASAPASARRGVSPPCARCC